MKHILFILLLFSGRAIAQFPNHHSTSNPHTLDTDSGAVKAYKGIINGIYVDTTSANTISFYPGAQIIVGNTLWLRDSTGTRWIVGGGGYNNVAALPDSSGFLLIRFDGSMDTVVFNGGSGSGGSLVLRQGGPITSLPFIGFNPNTTDIPAWIDTVFYRARGPLATLTGGVLAELQADATLNATLAYTSSRQASTVPFATIVIAGTNETFADPGAPGTVSGTQSVSYPANTDITYSNVTTTTDAQAATATTSFTFLPKRYYGFISDTTGIGTFGFNDAVITALNSELSNSKVKSWLTGDPTGTQFIVYAYYATAGTLTHFDQNGFPSIDAMNVVTRNFTNALGFTGSWIIYWSKNGQTLSSTVVAN